MEGEAEKSPAVACQGCDLVLPSLTRQSQPCTNHGEGKGVIRERNKPDIFRSLTETAPQNPGPPIPKSITASSEYTSHCLVTRDVFLNCPTLLRLISYSPALNWFNLSKKAFRCPSFLLILFSTLLSNKQGSRSIPSLERAIPIKIFVGFQH